MANPPFVPTAFYKVKTMVELADPKKGQSMIDLGSGDGRIPISFAKKGVQAVGYEYNKDLVQQSRGKIQTEKLKDLVTIYQKDFWDAPLSSYDFIVVFGMESIMKQLEYKIRQEAKKGTKVLSNAFQFRHLKLKQSKNDVHLYIVR